MRFTTSIRPAAPAPLTPGRLEQNTLMSIDATGIVPAPVRHDRAVMVRMDEARPGRRLAPNEPPKH